LKNLKKSRKIQIMTTDLWLNLPVKDLEAAKVFYKKMGFPFNEDYVNPNSACMMIGKRQTVVMLFEQDVFQKIINNRVTNTILTNEVLISIDAQNKDEIDEMAAKAVAAGGKSDHVPCEMSSYMYGCLFVDIDGHRWNVLYMDLNKMS
jgi:predicted lactoylglutathione lyase